MAPALSFQSRIRPIIFGGSGDFDAVDAAEFALEAAGFSVGRMQAHAPRGLLLGHYDIQKWRNLSSQERRVLDGEMHGGRFGDVRIVISATAGGEELAAFDVVRAAATERAGRLTELVGGMVVDA